MMKTRIISFLMMTLLAASTCFSQVTTAQPELSDDAVSDEVLDALMLTCYVCHNPRIRSENDIIAPPLVAVKYKYKSVYTRKEDFVDRIVSFVMEPTNEKALLRGPVKRFGVMPEMPMDEAQVRRIASYIYDNVIEEPTWFPKHFEEMHGEKWPGQQGSMD